LAYQVIARKWRPQSFTDLVGQEHVSTTLINALRQGRMPQALLFTGVRGTGKTSSARILAKSLRCPEAKDFVPCGKCSECEDIADSRSLDVIEIDGASNNGVDAIRELRETVGYMPSSGKYKIYIIDEVHMLSTSAFNALLKTLEEPPAHVVFIMATTEAQKIPNTILSRCQRFDFRRIPSRQIAAQLAKICEAEKIKTAPEALWLIARQADGSMRDSQSLLDQVITFSGGGAGETVTLEKAIGILGLTDRTLLLETLEALVNRDTERAVGVIEKIFSSGYDAKIYAQDLLEEIRNALLVRLCPDDPSRTVDLPDTEIEALRAMTSDLGDEDLHMLFDMTLKGVSDLLRAQDSRIVLEMLILRMAAAPRIASLAGMSLGGASAPAPAKAGPAKSTQQAQAKPASQKADASSAPTAVRIPYTAASFTRTASGAPLPESFTNPKPAVEAAPETPKAKAPVARQEDSAPVVDPARANDPWFKFVDSVKHSNSLLGAMLENTHFIGEENGKVTIGIPRKMSFLFDKVKETDNIRRIETFIATFWNRKVEVDVKLADPLVAEKVTPKAAADERKKEQKKSIEQAVERDPLVQTAQNVFKTQIKSIKDAGSSKDSQAKGKRETP
jgi:DNA polymerase-3 subunit gamma/tau